MWTWLHTEYYRDPAFTLVSQMMNLVSLPTQYSGTDLPGFISKFESQRLHLTKLSKASSNSYRKTVPTFLNEDTAKLDFLLGFLVQHHKNVIDTSAMTLVSVRNTRLFRMALMALTEPRTL